MDNFSQRLKKAIDESGLSKGAVAAALGVPQSSVSRWLAGSNPKAERVGEIAKLLRVDANWLIGSARPAWRADDAAAVREECQPCPEPPRAALREAGEPSLAERLEKIEKHGESMRESLEHMRSLLDELADLFTGRRPQ